MEEAQKIEELEMKDLDIELIEEDAAKEEISSLWKKHSLRVNY